MPVIYSKKYTTIQASAAKTTTFQTVSFDEGSHDKIAVMINATVVTGTGPSMTVNVEWSNDNVTWYSADPVDAFTPITAAATKVKIFDVKGLYGRLNCTISGTTPSFTFAAYAIIGA
jgi:hypothetical protein